MLQKYSLPLFLLVFWLTSWCAGCAHRKNPWKEVFLPFPSSGESVGSYSKGCLKGAISLPSDAKGFHVMRISRRRFYGHPSLVEFLYKLGVDTNKKHLGPLLLGDLSQPRGGPTLSGHVSHQSGLDVDIWFYQPKLASEVALLDARENLQAPSMLTPDGQAIDTNKWDKRHAATLKLAASAEAVERIFVNPVIKKELCLTQKGKREWLRKIRPWWGHDDHFHVRLKCPENNPLCQAQEATPEGEGCGPELEEEWFSVEAKEKAKKLKEQAPEPGTMPDLPEACKELI